MRMSASWRPPADSARAHSTLRVGGRIELGLRVFAESLGPSRHSRLQAEVIAWAVVRHVPRAVTYRLRIDDPEAQPSARRDLPAARRPARRRWRITFAPPAATGADAGPDATHPQRRGDHFWVPLARRTAWADDFAPEWEALWARFDGCTVTATVTVDEA